MKCPKCGALLQENQTKCPLCLTILPSEESASIPFFPETSHPRLKGDFKGILFLFTLFFFIAAGMVLALDLIRNGKIVFSFSIILPLLVFYAAFLLPRWFCRPNPVIFLPVVFVLVLGNLLYLSLKTGGGWFWTFVLPVLSLFFLFLEAAVTLLYYVRRGRLYIFGGLFLAFGVLSFVGEILYRVTFSLPVLLTYSVLPLIFFSLLGLGLIVIAIVPPFRRSFRKNFFI